MGTDLVGREHELALLGNLIAELPTASSVVIVTGEAGIGKTAVIHSVSDDSTTVGLRVLRGACAPMSGAVAYGGLDAALSSVRIVADEAYASASEGRARAVEAMLTKLGEFADDGVVLVVEDVHWADTSTLDFLAHLSRNLPKSGLLVLLSWRDEDTDTEHSQWLGEQLRNPMIIDLPLRRLTFEETMQQLSGYPAEIGAAVYGRSAGNPYLSAELARGGARPSASLRQVLGSRLDAVHPPARWVVGVAATLGRTLTDDELLVAAAGDEDAVTQAYEAGLMVRDPQQGSTARHPVLAEIAYERLLSGDRRLLHTRMAEHLAASLPAHPSAGAVAEVAAQYGGSGNVDQALGWAVRAAEAAEHGYSIAEAGHWYAVAASLWERADGARSQAPPKLKLLDAAATHLGAVGQADRAMALLDFDLSAEPGAGDPGAADLIARAALTRSWLGTVLGDTERALRDVELAERLTSSDDEVTWARIHGRRAMALGTCSRWEEALTSATMALDLGTRCADLRTVGTAHFLLGVAAVVAGNTPEGFEHHEVALATARRAAEPEDLALAGIGLTDLHWRLGDADQAARVAHVVRAEVRRLMLGRHWLEDIIDTNVVLALYESGRWDEALTWPSDPSVPSKLGLLQAALALIHLARGEIAAAEEMQAQGAALAERDQPLFLGMYGQVQASLLLQTGHADEALELTLSIAETVHGTPDEADEADLLLAGLAAAAAAAAPTALERLVSLLGEATKGRTGAAVTAVVDGERSRAAGVPRAEPWLIAADEWATLGRPYDEARARLRASEALLERQTGSDARRLAAEELGAARQLAKNLCAAPLLEDIDHLVRLARVDLEPRPDRGRAARRPSEPASDAIAWPPPLTEREQQVLCLLADGLTNREIGAALFMSPKTASVHVTHLMEKFGVHSRVQVAAMAARLGLDKQPPPPPS
ncbi:MULTISPECIES: AAA family ATPase [Kribbella]|uniref:helix-turn-helix transcriptional regulator n=1 Tax=Kribbella TaxID=182639 RepID=UPI0013051739|nr:MULTISPECIES: AAA family ATPase [Kribbella]